MGDRATRPFLRTPFNESTPRPSPDGRWLAYASDESGRQEIYVQPFPGPGGKWPISAEGGRKLLTHCLRYFASQVTLRVHASLAACSR